MKKILLILMFLSSLFALTNFQYQKQLGLGIDTNWILFPYSTPKVKTNFKIN